MKRYETTRYYRGDRINTVTYVHHIETPFGGNRMVTAYVSRHVFTWRGIRSFSKDDMGYHHSESVYRQILPDSAPSF